LRSHKIKNPSAEDAGLENCMLHDFESVEPCPKDNDLQQELLNLLVILKLNGGLGTSMGCKG
jgi:UDP-N-acetylglucosamine pyrophosphorylase